MTKTHNGWKNYPTWVVNLWLSNDEGLYHAAREIVERTTRLYDGPYFIEKGVPRAQVADALKTWVVEDLVPDLGASFAADLLGFALDQVHWCEIAQAWSSDLEEARA